MGHRFSKSIVSKDKDPSDVKNTASESISKEIDDHNNQLKQDNNNKVTNQNLQEIIQSQKFTSALTSTSAKTTTYPMNNKNLTSTITSTKPSTSLLSSSLSTSSTSSVSASTSSSIGQQFIIKIQLTKMETDPPITTNFEIINNENNQNNRNFSNININNDLINHSNLVTTESTSGNMGNKNSINIKTIEKSDMNNFNNNNNSNNNSGNSNNNLEQRNRFIDNSINNLNINNKRISISDQTNNTIEQINNNITEVMNDLNSQLEKCNLKLNKDDIIENIPLPDYQTMNAVDINNKQTNITNNDNSENLDKDVCDKKQHCSRRKKLLTTSGYPLTKRKCCKCCCRDNGTKKVQETMVDSNSKNINSTSSKDQQQKSSSNSKSSSEKSWTSRFTSGLKNKASSSESKTNITNNKTQSNNSQKNTSVSTTNSKASAPAPTPPNTSVASTVMVVRPQSTNTVPLLGDRFNNHSGTNQLAIWADNQMLVVQLPQASQLVLERFENVDGHGGIRQTSSRADAETQSEFNNCSNNKTVNAQNQWPPLISGIKFTTPIGPKVHSQEDFIHCLVPDLEKITASSFYWGKMDRYEAERLLDGKPEGTFLLRDSAQEEYLFSVTFRKYDRSLHARIEQLNHKFSFDCHDPGVFTAPTVTGLLEHYKDPTCVMFFEPMLTIPLNRNFPFSLQQLCRATIVSNVSYDGINELQLPNSLKSYLKEYHYKLRVRVKPFDETFYTCS